MAELLKRLGLELFRHVRPRDLACRFGDQRLAVALMSCQAKVADRVGERIAHNIGGAVLGELAGDPRGLLQIRWVHVTFPDDAATPKRLLRVAGRALDRQLFVRDLSQSHYTSKTLDRSWCMPCAPAKTPWSLQVHPALRPKSQQSWRMRRISSLFGPNRGDNSQNHAKGGVKLRDCHIITGRAAHQLVFP